MSPTCSCNWIQPDVSRLRPPDLLPLHLMISVSPVRVRLVARSGWSYDRCFCFFFFFFFFILQATARLLLCKLQVTSEALVADR